MPVTMRPLRTEADLEAVLRLPAAVVFKHSSRCAISLHAFEEMTAYVYGEPGLPVYIVDVLADRAVAQALAARTGIAHESPQALLLHAGRPAWHAAHGRITASALEAAVRDARS